jgi:hypothetical protein
MNFSINLKSLSSGTIRSLIEDLKEKTELVEFFYAIYKIRCKGDVWDDLSVKERIVSNPKCPSEILFYFINEFDYSEKEKSGTHGISLGELKDLAIMNPNLGQDDLLKIAEKNSLALANPSIKEILLEDMFKKINEESDLIHIANNPNCPEDLLVKILNSVGGVLKERIQYRLIEQEHKNVPVEVLLRVAGYPERTGKSASLNLKEERMAIARHKKCPIQLLEFMRENDHGYQISDVCNQAIWDLKKELGEDEFKNLRRVQEILYMGKHFI